MLFSPSGLPQLLIPTPLIFVPSAIVSSVSQNPLFLPYHW